jgi:predicted lipid-binding transport protein (Tim44 family)
VERVAVERLEAAADPPAMTVAVTVRGRRYVQQRDTAAIVAGSDAREQRFTVRWRLLLDGPQDAPWRLAGSAATASL